jgi:hypothetical protein
MTNEEPAKMPQPSLDKPPPSEAAKTTDRISLGYAAVAFVIAVTGLTIVYFSQRAYSFSSEPGTMLMLDAGFFIAIISVVSVFVVYALLLLRALFKRRFMQAASVLLGLGTAGLIMSPAGRILNYSIDYVRLSFSQDFYDDAVARQRNAGSNLPVVLPWGAPRYAPTEHWLVHDKTNQVINSGALSKWGNESITQVLQGSPGNCPTYIQHIKGQYYTLVIFCD